MLSMGCPINFVSISFPRFSARFSLILDSAENFSARMEESTGFDSGSGAGVGSGSAATTGAGSGVGSGSGATTGAVF